MNVITSDTVMFYKNLRSDGILTRYKNENEEKEEGVMDINNSSILVGEDVIGLDDRPPLELWMDGMLLMCIPYNEKTSWWLLFYNYQQLGDWMENMSLILKASEVQKDFILQNRLTHNTQDQFCQLKHTLKYRDEACHIPAYSINLPPTVIVQNPPPPRPTDKYDFDKIFNSKEYMPKYSTNGQRSDNSNSYINNDDHHVDYRIHDPEGSKGVNIPIRRSGSFDTKTKFDANIMPQNLTSSSSGHSKSILKKSRETVHRTESSTITSSESSVRFLEPERIHMMSNKRLADDVRIRNFS